ncbi:MAG: hypothetical protein P8N56_02180 [Schleiferiaceae bacterium]|nr:hypothetical protein [Schleiferiaceae bacterium]
MKQIGSNLLLLLGIGAAFSGCQNDPWDIAPVESEAIEFVAFADSVLPLDSASLLPALEHLAPKYSELFLPSVQGGDWRDDLLPYLQDPEVKALYQDVLTVQSEVPALQNAELLATIQAGLDRYDAHMGSNMVNRYPAKRLYTYVSRNEEPMVLIAPEAVFLPLDRYLGANHPAYARESAYMVQQHQPENAPVEIFKAIASWHYPEGLPSDFTLLASMLSEAKSVLFIQATLGDAAARRSLGYSSGDQSFLEENEAELWGIFVSQRWLFEDEIDLKRKLIQPAPFSKFGTPKDREIPGKAGVWFGWQILQSYWRQHPEASLQELMAFDNAQSLFQQSGYRP